MKINLYPLFLIVAATLLFSACRKDGSKPRGGNIVGRWQEVKLTLHQNNSATTSHDTTFSSASFSTGDYFSFNADGSAILSQTGIYAFGGKIQTIDGGTYLTSVNHFTYTVADTTLTLTSTDSFPTTANGSGPSEIVETVQQPDANHLVLRQRIYFFTTAAINYDPTLVITAYFTRKN